MSNTPQDKSLSRQPKKTSLSAGALKRGLQIAKKEALSPAELDMARRTNNFMRPLSDESVRLVVKEPPMWEYRLYFHALSDFVAKEAAAQQKASTPRRTFGVDEALDWVHRTVDEGGRLSDEMDRLVGVDLQIALGEPGQAGNAAGIVRVAKGMARIYRRFLGIRAEWLSTQVVSWPKEIPAAFGKLVDGCIQEFETYPARSLETIMKTLEEADENTEVVLRLEMTLNCDPKPLQQALRRARRGR